MSALGRSTTEARGGLTRRRVVLNVAHAPYGKARAGWGRAGSFKDSKTEVAELAIRNAWIESGAPMWPKGTPISIGVTCRFSRPIGHTKADGIALTTAGINAGLFATKKPDADNIMKTVMDALNKYAYFDDAQVVHIALVKLWTNGAGAIVVTLEEMSENVPVP
jgi:Holliday junction resolvase RusA-like endonuclease